MAGTSERRDSGIKICTRKTNNKRSKDLRNSGKVKWVSRSNPLFDWTQM